MLSLPSEVQLDIFKFLTYEKLYSIKQIHLYFCDFINNYEGELAREKFYGISIDVDRFKKGPYSKLIEPKTKNFYFPLNEELEEKWRNRRETPIPLYLLPRKANNIVICLSKVYGTECHLLQLPNFIKNKVDLKIKAILEDLYSIQN
uniref:F-box domain-containing protein n=1 Tax=Meloidogyne incognita TaxID=6306 RepID=A0A914MPK8_MELIC